MKDGATKAREEKERLLKLRAEAAGQTGDEPALDTDRNPIVPAPEVPVPDPPAPDLTQQFETLRAKYDSEVPRLHSWIREKDAKIAELTTENAELKRQLTERPQAPAAPQVDEDGKVLYVSPLVTDEIRQSDTYQYYLAEFGQTYAERQAEMAIKAAQSQVKPVQEELANTSAQTAEEKFHSALHSLCPEWQGLNEGINVDDNFVTWLEESFAIGSFRDAYRNADIETMASIINKYKSTIKQPAPKPTPPPAPPRAGGGMQTNLEANKGEILKMADLEALYQDFSRGVYRGKEAEYEAKKKVFLQARAEGRLV